MLQFYNQHKTSVKIAISIVIMAVFMLRIDMGSVIAQASDINKNVWLLAGVFMFTQIFLLAYRWFLIINAHEQRLSGVNALRVTLASLVANYLFITSIGGIIVRVAMSVHGGFSLMRSIAATALDRVMTLLALLILTVLFLPVLGDIASHDLMHMAVFTLSIFGLGGFLFVFLFSETLRRRVIFSHRKVTMSVKYLRTIMTDPNLLMKIIASSLVAQLSYFAAIYVVTVATGIEFQWLHFISILPLITVIASLPIGYGGWGIREGAFVYGLGIINIPVETAFMISVQIGLISMMCAFVAGIPSLISHKRKIANAAS